MQREIVDDEQLDPVQLAHLLVVGVIQTRGAQPLEHLVGAFDMNASLAADRGMTQRVGQERLADPDRAHDQNVVGVHDKSH
jgi:hypothetical protein